MSLLKFTLGRRFVLAASLTLSSAFGAAAQTATVSCEQPPNCIVNPHLTAAGGGDMNTGPGTFVNGWSVSHGTPTLWAGGPGSAPNGIWMWSYSGNGEGVYSCFNFQAGHTYRICLWTMNTNPVTAGNLNIFAATGLNGTGGPIPTPATSELISNAHTWVGGWTPLTYLYTPNANYRQLWIYPFRAGGPINNQQYELAIDNVHVVEVPDPGPIVVKCGDPLVLPGAPCGNYMWYSPTSTYLGTGPIVIPNATPAMSGTYTVRYGEEGCGGEAHVEVVVKDCPPCDEFKADFKINGCNPVAFNDVSSGPGTSVAWFWDFGDGTTSNLQNPVHSYSAPGTYKVCLTVIRRSGDETCCKRICHDVKACEPHDGEHRGENNESSFRYDYMGEGRQTLRFQDAVTGNDAICDYQWEFGDGAVSGLPNPAHFYAEDGTYTVTLKVTSCGSDANGHLVKGFTNTYRRQVQVSGAGKPEMAVMPNPAADMATVQVKGMSNVRVTLRDLYGKKVAVGRENGNGGFSLDLQRLAPGVYTVTVDGDRGQIVQKLVKK